MFGTYKNFHSRYHLIYLIPISTANSIANRTAIRYFLYTSIISTWLFHRNSLTGPCFQVNFLLPCSLLRLRPNNKLIQPCIVVILAGNYNSQRKLGNMSTDKLQINLSQDFHIWKIYFIPEYFDNRFRTYCFMLQLTMCQF